MTLPNPAFNLSRRSNFLLRAGFRLSPIALAILMLNSAYALSLGVADLKSSLGQPLRIAVPITKEDDEEIGCIQVHAKSDDMPGPPAARATVVAIGSRSYIEITSAQPVNEPAMGLVLSAGCSGQVSRAYVLLLDPPPVNVPVVVAPPSVDVAGLTAPRTSAPAKRTPRPGPGGDKIVGGVVPQRPGTRVTKAKPTATGTGITDKTAVSPAVSRPAVSGSKISSHHAKGHDVFRVSGGEPSVTLAEVDPVLKITSEFNAPDGPRPDEERLKMIRGERDRLMRELDGQSPAPDSAAAKTPDTEQSEKIRQLSEQNAELQKKFEFLDIRLRAEQASSFPEYLFWILGAIALLSLAVAGVLGWFVWRLRQKLHQQAPWWNIPADEGAEDYAEEPAADQAYEPEAVPEIVAEQLEPASANISTNMPAANAAEPSVPSGTLSDASKADALAQKRARAAAFLAERSQSGRKDSSADMLPLDQQTVIMPYALVAPAAVPPADAPIEFHPDKTLELPATRPGVSAPVLLPSGGAIDFDLDLDLPPVTNNLGRDDIGVATSQEQAAVDLGAFEFELPEPSEPAKLPHAEVKPMASPTLVTPAASAIMAPSLSLNFDLGPDFDLGMPNLSAPPAPPIAPVLAAPVPAPSISAAAKSPARAAEAPHKPEAAALNFDLPEIVMPPLAAPAPRPTAKSGSKADAGDMHDFAPMGADTILRLDAASLGVNTIVPEMEGAGQPSLLSRLRKYIDVIEKVDELAQTDPDKAIAQLRLHVLRDENIPTLMWLMLFGLYHQVNKRLVYDALSEHFARRYHRPMVKWDEAIELRSPQTGLDENPELEWRVQAESGTEAGLETLRSLLCGRDQSDDVVFNIVLQRELLEQVKTFSPRGK